LPDGQSSAQLQREWSVIALHFSSVVPCVVVSPGVSGSNCESQFVKPLLPRKPLTKAGAAGSCHHDVASGNWAVVSTPFLARKMLSWCLAEVICGPTDSFRSSPWQLPPLFITSKRSMRCSSPWMAPLAGIPQDWRQSLR